MAPLLPPLAAACAGAWALGCRLPHAMNRPRFGRDGHRCCTILGASQLDTAGCYFLGQHSVNIQLLSIRAIEAARRVTILPCT